jgi:hypothetical protein
MVTVYCLDCEGSGIIELCNWDGPYQVACPYCWQSLGEIDVNESEAHLYKVIDSSEKA